MELVDDSFRFKDNSDSMAVKLREKIIEEEYERCLTKPKVGPLFALAIAKQYTDKVFAEYMKNVN